MHRSSNEILLANMLVLASGGQRGRTAVVEHGSIHEQGMASGSGPVSAVHVSKDVQARTQANDSPAESSAALSSIQDPKRGPWVMRISTVGSVGTFE
jgi:hypothetical protein